MERIAEFKSKLELCVLTTQSGKTFMAISKIALSIEQDGELGRSIHMVFTMNTLLNNSQFAKRLREIEQTYGKGSVVVFSSKYDGEYLHVKSLPELQGRCFDEATCPRVVVMCSNKRRYDDGMKFLEVINRNRLRSNFVRAFAYFDELHKYLSPMLRTQIEEIHSLEIIHGITALSATPDKIFQTSGFWSKIRLVFMDNYSEENYAGARDMVFNCIDDYFPTPYVRPRSVDNQMIDYIEHVLKEHPEILNDGTYSFIPAHIRRTGHNFVRDLIFSINENAVVVLINGEEKVLQFKKGNIKTIPLIASKKERREEEVCETITRLLAEQHLEGRPVVVTGFLCVGMGQTLTHRDIGSFTSAVIGHMDLSNDDIYQLFGRVTGRMKDWPTYMQTDVYCPTTIMNRCIVMEECARNMICDYNGEIVTQEDYREPMTEMGDIGKSALENIRIVKKVRSITPVAEKVHEDKYRIYDNEAVVKKVCKILGYDYRTTKNNLEGFKETSLNRKKEVVSLKSAISKVPTSYSNHGEVVNWRTYLPCYLDVTDSETLRFVVIIRPTTDLNKVKVEVDTIYPSIKLA